jgi:hypothetical protein
MTPGGPYYREPEPDICQGDVFDGVPHAYVRDPLEVVREAKVKGKHRTFGLYPYPGQPGEGPDAPGKSVQGGPLDLGRGERAATFCQVAQGVLLNHDCDIEHEPGHRLVAMIYPLARVQQAEYRAAIERNQNYTRFFLPADALFPVPSYVDFRRISCVHPRFVMPQNRVTRLSEVLMASLFRQFFLFLTHRSLTDAALFGAPDAG